jgi:murein L,D-transpeptidase YcbB/YkuD
MAPVRRQFAVLILVLSAARPGGAEPGATIRDAVAALQHGESVTIGRDVICAAQPLPLFYTRRGLQPAWSETDARALAGAIRTAGDDGLNPADYHLAAIETLHGEPRDLLLTDAFFLLGSHLLSGRVDPVTIEPTWCLEPRTADLVPALETALETHDVAATLARFRPAHPGYRQLREALEAYRRLPPWLPVERGATLRPGSSGPRLAQLVARLAASGELTGAHSSFDAGVGIAVRRFQRLHGLEEDGVVGPRTLRELNVSRDDRIRQLELNLERWRWLPATLGERHVVINLPQFELSIVERERAVASMRIIVGKDFDHRTPVFTSVIERIVFSPCWNVPDSIADRELWPKQRRDPAFFEREHVQVMANGRLRQAPGPWNALGLIKFDLPNRYAVYLHDTPARELFDRSMRTFSHGCIRLEKPVDLAAYLLPGWTPERIVTESKTGVEHTVNVPAPLMVHVLYWTALVDQGELRFAPDIYDRDPALDRAMGKRPDRF